VEEGGAVADAAAGLPAPVLKELKAAGIPPSSAAAIGSQDARALSKAVPSAPSRRMRYSISAAKSISVMGLTFSTSWLV